MAPRIVPSKNYLTQLILHNVPPQHQPESCSLRSYRLAPSISIHNHAACAFGVNLHHIPRRTKMARRRIVCSGIVTSTKPLEHSRPCGAGQFFRGTHTIAAFARNGETVEYNPKNVSHTENIKIEFPLNDTNYDISPSWSNERTKRDKSICKVRHAIQYKYGPGYDVQPYGSSVYMAMPVLPRIGHGDLDLVVLDTNWPQGFSPEIDMKHLPPIYNTRKLARTMQHAGFTDVEAVPWAQVPIVKFTDPASGLHIDVNVNERLGLMNTGLIKTYCDIVPNLRCLISAIKQWARPRALNQPSISEAIRTFNSYALVLMTIGWLQTRDLAPKLQAGLQPMESNEHLFWMRPSNSSKRIPCDTRYRKPTTWVAPHIDVLDNLVEQWFRFWAEFQFSRHVIDIKRGGIFLRIPHFEEAAEPDYDSRGPRSEPNSGWSTFLGPDVDSRTMLESYPISVVDPFIRSKNVTRGINAQALHMFQAECAGAVELRKLGTDMTDIIDGFDMLKQDYNGHLTARLQQTRRDPHGQSATVLKAEEVDAIPDWSLVSRQPPESIDVLRYRDLKRDDQSVDGRILSDTLESSHIPNEQIRDSEEGFGLKPSYFHKIRRV
ncbi:hypothetical protein C8R48DRAFT_718513 [Suillus tomentosus]|nr:hypothetical protein C8R48DRAFT_718513 [Suillus tomentosus]